MFMITHHCQKHLDNIYAIKDETERITTLVPKAAQ